MRGDCTLRSLSLLKPVLTPLPSVTSELSREDMLSSLKGWLSRVNEERADLVLNRVQAIAELHAGQPRGVGA